MSSIMSCPDCQDLKKSYDILYAAHQHLTLAKSCLVCLERNNVEAALSEEVNKLDQENKALKWDNAKLQIRVRYFKQKAAERLEKMRDHGVRLRSFSK